VVSLITGAHARGVAEVASYGFGNQTVDLARAASLAALSNVLLTWAGVGILALLVVWAVHRGLSARLA